MLSLALGMVPAVKGIASPGPLSPWPATLIRSSWMSPLWCCNSSVTDRGEMGHHHHISGPYLLRFAQEAAWREDSRRVANGEQVTRVATLAMAAKPSVDFCGYWQRHQAA